MSGKPTLLILAAGMASRYGSLKQLERFGPSGETIIEYSVYDAIRAGFGKIVFVIRRSLEKEFRNELISNFADRIQVETVAQELDMLPGEFTVPENRIKPWGTGHAVLVAAEKIDEPFAVINADDFYGFQSFKTMADFLQNNKDQNLYAMVGYRLKNTLSKNGTVSRGVCSVDHNHYLESITEYTKILDTEKGIVAQTGQGNEVSFTGNETASMNMMGFDPSVFHYFSMYFNGFLSEERHDPKAEFFLPTVVNKLIDSGIARVKVLETPEKWFGVTYQDDKPLAVKNLQELSKSGIYPEKLWGRSNN